MSATPAGIPRGLFFFHAEGKLGFDEVILNNSRR